MFGQSSGLPMQRKFLVQVFAVKKEGSDQYRSVIFPADRAMEGALFCEIHFKTSSRAIEGCLMELELTDSEATLLGWPPELLDD